MKTHLIKSYDSIGRVCFYPADEDSETYMKKLSAEEIYYNDIKRSRNYLYHKKFFAMIGIGHKATTLPFTFDRYRKFMTMKSGHFDSWTYDGYTNFEAKSINFETIDQTEFEEIYEKVLQVVARDIGLTNEKLEEEVLTHF